MLAGMTTTISLPRTGRRSVQLTAASERMTLDPFTEIDWETPIDDRAYHLPPEWLPLYGTARWEAMTPEARITYSRHECAALCGAGIWFENRLMQLVLQHLAELPVDCPAHRYLLVEVADECRHSTMFGEYIRRGGTPAYGPRADAGALDALGDVPGTRALGYVLILAVEELLDAINRATMKDDRIHPVSRHIAKLHVAEEARHVSFAKTYLAEVWPTLDEEERRAVQSIAPTAVAIVADLTIDPAVYETLGIVGGEEDARANPHHRARVVEGLAKLTSFLQQLGVIDDALSPTWRELGLVA
jgi:ribosomal protein S18 acetylase RimI-like enzyme